MSKITKGKHVKKEVIDDYYVPEGEEQVVRVVAGRGNNLHEVEGADKQRYLVSMPTKYRKNVWIKRGDFVIVDPIKEGNKVQAEIVYILYPKQIKYLKHEKLWPAEFSANNPCGFMQQPAASTAQHAGSLSSQPSEPSSSPDHEDTLFPPLCNPNADGSAEEESETSDDDDDDGDDQLFQNPNHRPVVYYSEDETSSDEDDQEEEEEDKEEEEDEEEENDEQDIDEEVDGSNRKRCTHDIDGQQPAGDPDEGRSFSQLQGEAAAGVVFSNTCWHPSSAGRSVDAQTATHPHLPHVDELQM